MSNRIFNRPVDGALYLFEKGFKVFPCVANGKTPAIMGWQDWAKNCTEKKIREHAIPNPTNNWGVYCDGLTVIDVDNKENRKGLDTLESLPEKLPETFTVQTPTGGLHYYYVGTTRNTVDDLGSGLDTRSLGGYVVAPGSRIEDNTYELVNGEEMAKLPSWIVKKLGERKPPVVLEDNQIIEEGSRDKTLASLAGSMRNRGMGYEAILAALSVVNAHQIKPSLPETDVERICASISRYSPQDAKVASDFLDAKEGFSALTANNISAKDIKPRDWIMKNRYVGNFVSMTVAKGGAGKSTLTMLDAVAVATGKNLTGFDVVKKGAVWIYNTEDPIDELKRRMVAISMHHKILLEDMKDVHISTGRERPFILVKSGKDGVVINQQAMDDAVRFIIENKIILLLVDPFVRAHEVSENDNMAIDKVVWCFQRIMDRTGCAVSIVHHVNKGNSKAEPGEMDGIRGASSLVNAARIAHTLTTMTALEAVKYGVDENKRNWYVRLDNAKSNMSAPSGKTDWFKRVSVSLMNGDEVGTIEKTEIVEMKKELDRREKQSDADVVAHILSTILTENGGIVPVTDVIKYMQDRDDLNILVGEFTEKAAIKRIVDLIENFEVKKEHLSYHYLNQRINRISHNIVCKHVAYVEDTSFLD